MRVITGALLSVFVLAQACGEGTPRASSTAPPSREVGRPQAEASAVELDCEQSQHADYFGTAPVHESPEEAVAAFTSADARYDDARYDVVRAQASLVEYVIYDDGVPESLVEVVRGERGWQVASVGSCIE